MDLEKRILTTNNEGLIAMLFERLIDNFKACISYIDKKEYYMVEELNNNSRAILAELLVQFSGDDEISLTLREINLYINKLITEGEFRRNLSLFETCIKIITPICQGFQQLEIRKEPKAVAGLTYGKNILDEYTLKDSKSFRG